MNDINKKIKKIAKETTKNIVGELEENDWFVSSSYGDIGCYEKELKVIIKKACKDVVKSGYKKGMAEDVIKETVDIASESISHSISVYDDYYDSYKSNLKSYVKEALKSCDKLRESEREEKTRAVIEEIKSRPGHTPGRVIFSSTRSQQAENTREKYYAISEEKLIELISDQNKLNALESGGVDNWPYYS